jgi:uncharacterized Zn finger protein (UPF0148 family)
MTEPIKQIKMTDVSMGFCDSCGVVLVNPERMEWCPVCENSFIDYEIGPNNEPPTRDRTGYTLFKKPEVK